MTAPPERSRHEHGSTLPRMHSTMLEPTHGEGLLSLPSPSTLIGSGRIALALLLAHGHQTRGWRRCWIPTYYCEDVVENLRAGPVAIRRYPCGPDDPGAVPELSSSDEGGDVVVRVNYFGWGLPAPRTPLDVPVIEDHTHDPVAGLASEADYAFASLRKTFPLPDGGILWSPSGHAIPRPPAANPRHTAAAELRLEAMAIKRRWLDGDPEARKEEFRRLDLRAEEFLLEGTPAPISVQARSLLEALPIGAWREARGRNHRAFRKALQGQPHLTVLGPPDPEAPPAAIVQVETGKLRDELRSRLAQERIYTAVLWPEPTSPVPERRLADQELSSTTLAVHVDARYDEPEMERVAGRMASLTALIAQGD